MKKRAIKASCIFAGALFFAAVPLALRTQTASAQESAEFDFSLRGYAGANCTAADLLQEVYSAPVEKAEADWLNESGLFSLRYSDAVPVSYAEIASEGERVSVTARPYRYLSGSGKEVVFTPVSAHGIPFDKVGESYSLTLDGATVSEDSLQIFYETTFTIPAAKINEVARAAYENGAALKKRIEEDGEGGTVYLAERAQYEADLKAYQAYLAAEEEYEAAAAEYEAYLKAYRDWSKRDAAYRAYLAEYERYLAEKEAFEQYERDIVAYQNALKAYRDYLAALKEYEADYEAFVTGLDSPEQRVALEQIRYLDFIEEAAYIKEGDDSPRTLYSAIMGNAVSTVLDNSDALINYSKSYRAPVQHADSATRILREDILPKYHALRTASAEEKYSFYIGYADAARDAFCELFRSLDWLYRQKIVRAAIESRDRIPQYRILLAQLFYICNYLTDGPVANYDKTYLHGGKRYDFDDSYRIDGYKPADLLIGANIPADGENAQPLAGGVPVLPALPERPTEVPAPGEMPKRPIEPVEPERVETAGEAPMPVTEPAKPEEVVEPIEPQPFLPTPTELALAEAFPRLSVRAPREEDYILTARATCTKFISGDFATLRYYFTEDGGQFYETECRKGELPDTSGLAPYKTRTGYSCTFSGWQLHVGGERVPFDAAALRAGERYELYPAFSETAKSFPVRWEVDGKVYEDVCEYGQSPFFDGIPERRGEGAECYRFTGWSDGENFYPVGEDLPPMSEVEARYYACFEPSSLLVWKGGQLPVTYEEGRFSSDVGAAYLPIDISALFERASEYGAEVTLSFSGTQFLFSEEAVQAVWTSGSSSLLLSVAVSDEGARSSYHFRTMFGGGQPDCTVSVRTRAYIDPAHAYLFDGNGSRIAFRTEGEELLFSMPSDAEFILRTMYSVVLTPSEDAPFSTSAKEGLAQPGDAVTVEVGRFAAGKELGSIYVVGEDGEEIPLTENTFTMPEGDVTVGITAAYHVYTVVFYSDGKAVRTQTYRSGEKIIPPADPSKPSDGEYSFTFTGWDHEIGVCTKDDNFNAVYAREKLPAPPEKGPSKLYIMMLTAEIVLPILFAAGCFLIAFFIVRKVRRRRARAAASLQETPPSEGVAEKGEMPSAPENEGVGDASSARNGEKGGEKEGKS